MRVGCYCKGNDRCLMKIFSGLAKSISFWNKYLTWRRDGILEIHDSGVTYYIGGDRFINGWNLPFIKLSNLCTYFELWYLSGQWKIIDKFSAKFCLEQQILVKFISVYIRKGNVQLINMVNIGKEKSAG